jgi:hypothetical protein
MFQEDYEGGRGNMPEPFSVSFSNDRFTVTGSAADVRQLRRTGPYSEETTNNRTTLTFQRGEGFVDFRHLGVDNPTINVNSTVQDKQAITNYAAVGTVYDNYSGMMVPNKSQINFNLGSHATIQDQEHWWIRRNTAGWFTEKSAAQLIHDLDLNGDGNMDFRVYKQP